MSTKKSSGKLDPNKLPASAGVLLTAQAIGREMYIREEIRKQQQAILMKYSEPKDERNDPSGATTGTDSTTEGSSSNQ